MGDFERTPAGAQAVSPAPGDADIAVMSSVASKGGRNDNDESCSATSVHQR
jgi:hypothetical protein